MTAPSLPLPPSGVVPPVPDPADLDPLVETWPQSRELFRAHQSGRDAREANPGFGSPTRFAFFEDPAGQRVPVLYAGATVDVAIAERVFHDLPMTPQAVLLLPQYRDVSYTRIAPRRPLRLAALHGEGLRRLGLRNHQLCDTDAVDFPDTVQWAAALHSRTDLALDGLIWMSRQINTEQAVVLFGDRVPATDLDRDTDRADVTFRKGSGLADLLKAAERAKVRVQTPRSKYLT